MRNNNGFTLVELLATIVIIALIGGLGTVAYTTIIRQSEVRVYEAYEQTMRAETIQLLSKHVELIPKNKQTKKYYLSDIKIEPINNPRNSSDLCQGSYVQVKRDDFKKQEQEYNTTTYVDAFEYKVCLICNDYKTSGC